MMGPLDRNKSRPKKEKIIHELIFLVILIKLKFFLLF